ncbi:MAG: hypothetical protein JO112_11355 [Planctomycetes bacterium]|nr:hypothetical protein [Planctomycetota bacterium]
MGEKVTETLVEALKQAMMQPGEQRLFKSGKLEGLLPTRHGAGGEAADKALRDGLLEVVRTEVKGKTSIDWVRLTPRGVEFLYEHESSLLVLEELRRVLQQNREGVPAWLGQIQQEFGALVDRLAESAALWTHRLEVLSQRVEEALRRADAARAQLPNGMADVVPWALEALVYLDRRRAEAANEQCPLPELYAALRQKYPELSISAFHDGLRRLHDRRALQLCPFTSPSEELPEPEYALLDGSTILYYASR